MQDRFKKKLWHTNRKEFIKEFSILQTVNSEGNFEHTYFERNKLLELERLSTCQIKEIQCTGLKDKNGKLIYEGDIIVIANQYPFYDYKNEKESQNLNDTNGKIKGETILNYVGVVEYIFNCWQYVLNCVNPLKRGVSNGINYHLNEQGFEEDENSCYEVIGNIYKNPELLTGAEN